MQALNVPVENMLTNARRNLARDLPMFVPGRKSEEVCIVGGGPSLSATLPNLRMRYNRGATIWALNGAMDWLQEHHLTPDAMVLLDARPEMVGMLRNLHKKTIYYVAAQCDPAVFDALSGYEVRMWVGYCPGIEAVASEFPQKPIVIVGGGNTVGLKALCMASLCQFQRIHLFGFDSCYGESHHAYPQPLNDGEKTMGFKAAGRSFTAAGWMARQAQDFVIDYRNATAAGAKVTVHGDGLIPHIAKQLSKEPTHV